MQEILIPYKKAVAVMYLLLMAAVLALPLSVSAAVAPYNIEPAAKLSFTFDDGLLNAFTQAAPTLAAHGLAGTAYVATTCVGMSAVPNSCAADPDVAYMNWEQVTQLRDTYGWEIGGHAASHPQLSTDGLTDEQLAREVSGGKQIMVDHGINPISFATPYGDYDNRVLAEIAKSYASHRGFWDTSTNVWPYNNYVISNMQVQAGVSVSSVLSRIDQAVANKEWLVLTFHGIEVSPSSNLYDYQYSTANLNTIAAYAKSKQNAGMLKVLNMKDGLVASNTNMLPNGNLSGGMADGWSTDTPGSVTADSGNHGSYPESQHSALLTARPTGNAHLFTPTVNVQSNKTYMMQSYLNLVSRTGGELGYYIDEYNAAGNWISGQWKGAKTSPTVTDAAFTYMPSSPQVTKAKLQVYVTPGSGIRAYVDTFRWYPLDNVDTPPPTPQNLLPNSSFDKGIDDGWSTDSPTLITADGGGRGSPANPQNAVKLVSSGQNTHLFSPRVAVHPGNGYSLSGYLDMRQIASGEVGFYVDEYDAAGNWISGQYLSGINAIGAGEFTFDYLPRSGNVAKASLQVIVVGGANIVAYLDDLRWHEN